MASSFKEQKASDLTPDMLKLVYLSTEEARETKDKQATESVLDLDISNISFEDTFNCSVADD